MILGTLSSRITLCALLLAPGIASAITISSDFAVDLDGWMISDGDPNSTVQWEATGGNPDGHLRVNEAAQGAIDRIAAPAKFLGNKSAFVGGTFSLDRNTNILSSPLNRNDDVIFTGASVSIRFNLPSPGLNTWVTETIDLTASSGWVLVSNSTAPTSTQFANIMGDLTAITLLADFRTGPETPRFDNITLTAIPEPATASLLVGLAAFSIIALRRRKR